MTSRILVAVRVPGPPDRAFRVFTDEVGDWWRSNPLFAFTGGGGRVAFEPPVAGGSGRFVEIGIDGTIFVIGVVTVWDRGRRLVFGWRQASFALEQNTEVDVTFESVGDETRVTVRHSGWDGIPAPHVARHGMPDRLFAQRHGQWWQALLMALAARAA